MAERTEVVVVGAGLAGLACAADLCAAGLPVVLVEASDNVGGRVRTDRVDGFRLDRGFQLFNTSYPQVKRRFVLRDLRLRAFDAGVLMQTARGRLEVCDPTRVPRASVGLLPGRLGSARDMAAFAALSVRDAVAPPRWYKRGLGRAGLAADTTTRNALRRAGVSERLCAEFFRPFLAGVFLEDGLQTSARYFHLVWRSFVRGTACLPTAGMSAVPEQLAARLPPNVLRLSAPVARLTDEGVELAGGAGTLTARQVVVATEPAVAAGLVEQVDEPVMRSVTTFYHAAERSPLGRPIPVMDAEGSLLSTVVVSDVVPQYAPPGRALIASSVLGVHGDDAEGAVRARAAELYRVSSAVERGWQHLATYPIAGALPAMPPPWPLSRTTRVGRDRYVCGDHRATGSIQGALASGARAAREVLEDRAAAF